MCASPNGASSESPLPHRCGDLRKHRSPRSLLPALAPTELCSNGRMKEALRTIRRFHESTPEKSLESCRGFGEGGRITLPDALRRLYRSEAGPSLKRDGTNVCGSAGSVRSACCRGVSGTSGGGRARGRDHAIWETQYL